MHYLIFKQCEAEDILMRTIINTSNVSNKGIWKKSMLIVSWFLTEEPKECIGKGIVFSKNKWCNIQVSVWGCNIDPMKILMEDGS